MTNAVLNLAVLAALAIATGPRLRRLRPGPLGWTALVLLVMTAVFDTVMIGAGLYEYDPDRILGLRVLDAPIEDFAYPLAAAAAMPVLWTAMSARSRARGDDPTAEPDPGTPT